MAPGGLCRPVLDLAFRRVSYAEEAPMSLSPTEEAFELLLIEEADAWFEYLEATRGQTEFSVQGGRALGVGPAEPAPTRDPRPARPTPPCGA